MIVGIEKSKDNYNILRIEKDEKNLYIGSKYSQKRELDKFSDCIGNITEKDVYIIFGVCALEHIKVLLKEKYSTSKILIIEPISEIIDKINSDDTLREYFDREDVILTGNLNEIELFLINYIDEFNIDYVKQASFANYNKIFSEELIDSYKVVKDYIMNIRISKNTNEFFKDEWVESNIINSKFLYESTKLNKCKDMYKDIPAIIVSAGPSLQKNIKQIDKEKAIIISGGRTLKSLLEVGIDPDFMPIVDGSQASYELVEDYLDKTNTKLVYNELTNSKILNNYKGSKIVSAQDGFIKRILGNNSVDMIRGGSVAHAMTFVATYMGCNPIIFVGQDLAYTDNKGHAECAKTKNVSVEGEKNYFSSFDKFVKDINGNEVRTSVSLDKYRVELENIISNFKDTTFINATEGGAMIKGTVVKELKEVLKTFENIKRKNELDRPNSDLNLLEKTIEDLRVNIDSSKKVIRYTESAIVILQKFERLYRTNSIEKLNNTDKELKKIEEKINKELPNLTIVDSLMQKLSYDIEGDKTFVINKADDKKTIVNKKLKLNSEIYSRVNEICKVYLPKMQKALKELEDKYKDIFGK